MKRKKLDQYQKAQNRALSYKEVYDLYHGQSLSWKEVCEKTGYSRNSVFRILRTFEAENPKMADQMKKKVEMLPQRTTSNYSQRLPVCRVN